MTDMSDDNEGHSQDGQGNMPDMSDDSEEHVNAGRWMTVPQAALHYRKSTKTIERWAEAGKLQRHTTAKPVEVWVSGMAGEAELSDMSVDISGPEERAIALAERMSDTVGRQLSPILAALERTEERARTLERESGVLSERVAGLERELTTVRQSSDTEHQRLTADLEAARIALEELKVSQVATQAEAIGRLTAELEARAASQAPSSIVSVWSVAWRYWSVLTFVSVALMAFVLLLVWPR
jgi:chromosome segregation ATPase